MNQYFLILEKLKPFQAELVAVSKTKPTGEILQLYDLGQRDLGENRVQDLIEKYEKLPKDIRWHMIGHLQRNKVKYLVPFIFMIHSADSLSLMKEIEKQAAKINRKIKILLQVKIAEEESKFGLSFDECIALINSEKFKKFEYLDVCGLMGMASFTDDMDQVRREFKGLKSFFDKLKSGYFKDKETFKEISMGMSGDYEIALEEGATLVRIGSLIFGPRQ